MQCLNSDLEVFGRLRCLITPLLPFVVSMGVLCSFCVAGPWIRLGPDGGDARSLAYDPSNPDRIFLGTSSGSLFVSNNGGRSWSWYAQLGGDDYVIDHIVIDPRNPAIMFVAAWSVSDPSAGDVFRSRNGGKTWMTLAGIHGKPVHALAIALIDPKLLVAGTSIGVYQTRDDGDTWQQISISNNAEIRNVESIAIDPHDATVIYAGTSHLAWKTADAGKDWHRINSGMIDDSDVFSIIMDPRSSSTMFVSACSGIYRSNTGGESFRKVQGIPFSARRTRILTLDPRNSNVIYAGTTQGLWKTEDAGNKWRLMSNVNLVVNDLVVDPRNSSRLLLATDRNGVLTSDDGGQGLSPSNHGYSHRYVTTILADAPHRMMVGVANDHEFGGVFSLGPDGTWQQKSNGLEGRDVLVLRRGEDGSLIAGTNRGIFVLHRNATKWEPNIVNRQLARHSRVAADSPTQRLAAARINDVELVPGRWLAATSAGLFASTDRGKTWHGGPVLGRTDFRRIRSNRELLIAATHREILISHNTGATWQVAKPSPSSNIRGIAVTSNGTIFLAAREGAFRSSDSGDSWQKMGNGLPELNLSSISYDPDSGVLRATNLSNGIVYRSHDDGRNWSADLDTGYPLRDVEVVQGRLVGITSFEGIVAEQ